MSDLTMARVRHVVVNDSRTINGADFDAALDSHNAEVRHNERIITTEHAREHYEQVLTGLDSMSVERLVTWLDSWTTASRSIRAMLESDAINEGVENL